MYVRGVNQTIIRTLHIKEVALFSPIIGTLWFNPTTKILRTYSNDGWVEVDYPTLSGYRILQTPTANVIPLSTENGKLNITWITQANEENVVLITQQPLSLSVSSKITDNLISS